MIVLVVFWLSVFTVSYTYLIYPLMIYVLARLTADRPHEPAQVRYTVSFILAVRNETARLVERVSELRAQLRNAKTEGEILVVLDGPEFSRDVITTLTTDPCVRVFQFSRNRGKAAAISVAALEARHEILVFADVRQYWERDALTRLLSNFSNPGVGAVSGDLVLDSGKGINRGVGLYWRFEKWLRKTEAKYDSLVGVTGAICAVRKALFEQVPEGTILDDVYWPLKVAMRGFRVVHEPLARAYDRLPLKGRDEFRRKIRTLSGNFQLVTLLPTALLPWKNRLWWQFISHKLMRLSVPWALMVAFATSSLINGDMYEIVFKVQAALVAIILTAGSTGTIGRFRVLAALGSFGLLNLSAWLAFWVWLSGRSRNSWSNVPYSEQCVAMGALVNICDPDNQLFPLNDLS